MDDTTTNTDELNQADDSSQPEETIERSADSLRSDTETPEPSEDESTEDENSEEEEIEIAEDESNVVENDDLKKWAKAKGVDPDDPKALLKLAKDIEKGFKKYTEKSSQLQKRVQDGEIMEGGDAVIQEARILNFYATNPEARNYDVQMGQIIERFENKDPIFAEHLLKNLDTLYAMARTEASSVEIQAARQEGKDEAIKESKKAQTASAPRANASSSQPAQQAWTDNKVREVIANGEYDKYRDEILKWERSQYGIK